jgi:hypothetical protein
MAFAMTVQGPASAYIDDDISTGCLPFSLTTPGIQVADIGANNTRAVGATQTLPAPCTRFRLIVSVKTLTTAGVLNDGPIFYLEVADTSNMATNLTALGPYIQAVNIASATEPQFLIGTFLCASTPKGFVRIIADSTLMGGGTVTYDAVLIAT